MNSRSNWLSYQDMSSTRSQSQLCTATTISSFRQFSHFISAIVFVSCYICFKQNFAQVTKLLAEWIGTYDISQLVHMFFRSSYRKLAWVGFEPTTTEFYAVALTNWFNRPRVSLALIAKFLQLISFHLLFSVHISFRALLSSVATFDLSETSHK